MLIHLLMISFRISDFLRNFQLGLLNIVNKMKRVFF